MKNLMKILVTGIAASLIAVSLGGCADELAKFKSNIETAAAAVTTGKVGEVAPSAAIAAIATYDAGVVLATRYQSLKRCNGANGPLCRNPVMRQRIDAAVYSGRAARNDLKAFMRANPGAATPATIYDALVAANSGIDDATAAYRAALGQ